MMAPPPCANGGSSRCSTCTASDTVLACVQEMIGRTEISVRDEIRKIPDGT